jgi:hypothetical protein
VAPAVQRHLTGVLRFGRAAQTSERLPLWEDRLGSGNRGPHRQPTQRLGRLLPVILGLILALASAAATNLAFLFKHRGAVLAPPILVRRPLHSAVGLFRSRWFLVGWIVAIAAWGLHVGALLLAPLSIVQAVLSGGLVFLAVFAERFLRLSPRTATMDRGDDHRGGTGGDRTDRRSATTTTPPRASTRPSSRLNGRSRTCETSRTASCRGF